MEVKPNEPPLFTSKFLQHMNDILQISSNNTGTGGGCCGGDTGCCGGDTTGCC